MTDEETMAPPEELLEEARRVRRSSYAPYSGFRVAAALEDRDGRIHTGVNVESASSPVGTCAERVALGAAVTAGARRFRRLVLVTSAARPASPCGMCRQALAEFGTDLRVWSSGSDGRVRTWTLEELLPDAFRRGEAAEAGAGDDGIGRASAGDRA